MLAKLKIIYEAVLMIASIFTVIKNFYRQWQEKKIEKHYAIKARLIDKHSKEIDIETAKPKEKQDDEKLKELHRKLVNLNIKL